VGFKLITRGTVYFGSQTALNFKAVLNTFIQINRKFKPISWNVIYFFKFKFPAFSCKFLLESNCNWNSLLEKEIWQKQSYVEKKLVKMEYSKERR